ncbi:MAG: recombinase RecA, partial [Candidatus Hodarchaeales archaeon]
MIENLYQKIIKKYGQDQRPVYILSSGSILLDWALGGGYPSGRFIEIYGQEGSGKTTLGIYAMRQAQKAGLVPCMLDMENSFNPDYAKTLGLGQMNEDYLYFCPEYGEQAVEIIRDLLPDVELFVIDSVSAMIPKAEYKGDTGEAYMGLQARLMGQACRQLAGIVGRAGAIIIF